MAHTGNVLFAFLILTPVLCGLTIAMLAIAIRDARARQRERRALEARESVAGTLGRAAAESLGELGAAPRAYTPAEIDQGVEARWQVSDAASHDARREEPRSMLAAALDAWSAPSSTAESADGSSWYAFDD